MPSQREGTVLENLEMAMVNGWLVPMDNQFQYPPKVPKELCSLSFEYEITTRKLYKMPVHGDNETFAYTILYYKYV